MEFSRVKLLFNFFCRQLLIMLCENSYFSQYGTFLGDCEQDRENLGVYTKTVSYWTHLFRPDLMKTILSVGHFSFYIK